MHRTWRRSRARSACRWTRPISELTSMPQARSTPAMSVRRKQISVTRYHNFQLADQGNLQHCPDPRAPMISLGRACGSEAGPAKVGSGKRSQRDPLGKSSTFSVRARKTYVRRFGIVHLTNWRDEMIKTILVRALLPVAVLLSNSAADFAAESRQQNSEEQTGTLERMLVT